MGDLDGGHGEVWSSRQRDQHVQRSRDKRKIPHYWHFGNDWDIQWGQERVMQRCVQVVRMEICLFESSL